MTRIENTFIRSHFQADHIEEIDGGWETVQKSVLNARNILNAPEHFRHADFDYLERLDLEGTCCLLSAPVQYIV